MRDRVNYRDVRSTPPRVDNLSQLKNDLNILSKEDIIKLIQDSRSNSVLSVNGQVGNVNLTMPTVKRQETYSGVTNASGQFSVTYSTPFSSVPDVQPQLTAGTASQTIRITSSTVNGFTVTVTNRASTNLLGVEILLAATTLVANASVSVLVTAR